MNALQVDFEVEVTPSSLNGNIAPIFPGHMINLREVQGALKDTVNYCVKHIKELQGVKHTEILVSILRGYNDRVSQLGRDFSGFGDIMDAYWGITSILKMFHKVDTGSNIHVQGCIKGIECQYSSLRIELKKVLLKILEHKLHQIKGLNATGVISWNHSKKLASCENTFSGILNAVEDEVGGFCGKWDKHTFEEASKDLDEVSAYVKLYDSQVIEEVQFVREGQRWSLKPSENVSMTQERVYRILMEIFGRPQGDNHLIEPDEIERRIYSFEEKYGINRVDDIRNKILPPSIIWDDEYLGFAMDYLREHPSDAEHRMEVERQLYHRKSLAQKARSDIPSKTAILSLPSPHIGGEVMVASCIHSTGGGDNEEFLRCKAHEEKLRRYVKNGYELIRNKYQGLLELARKHAYTTIITAIEEKMDMIYEVIRSINGGKDDTFPHLPPQGIKAFQETLLVEFDTFSQKIDAWILQRSSQPVSGSENTLLHLTGITESTQEDVCIELHSGKKIELYGPFMRVKGKIIAKMNHAGIKKTCRINPAEFTVGSTSMIEIFSDGGLLVGKCVPKSIELIPRKKSTNQPGRAGEDKKSSPPPNPPISIRPPITPVTPPLIVPPQPINQEPSRIQSTGMRGFLAKMGHSAKGWINRVVSGKR